jgi:hypothetical protein
MRITRAGRDAGEARNRAVLRRRPFLGGFGPRLDRKKFSKLKKFFKCYRTVTFLLYNGQKQVKFMTEFCLPAL